MRKRRWSREREVMLEEKKLYLVSRKGKNIFNQKKKNDDVPHTFLWLKNICSYNCPIWQIVVSYLSHPPMRFKCCKCDVIYI